MGVWVDVKRNKGSRGMETSSSCSLCRIASRRWGSLRSQAAAMRPTSSCRICNTPRKRPSVLPNRTMSHREAADRGAWRQGDHELPFDLALLRVAERQVKLGEGQRLLDHAARLQGHQAQATAIAGGRVTAGPQPQTEAACRSRSPNFANDGSTASALKSC